MHTVVAMNGERVVRVLCLSCRKEHAYRRPADQKDPGPRRSRSSKGAAPRRVTVVQEWEREMERLQSTPAKAYAMDGSFNVGDKIAHRTFGSGVVIQDVSSAKMEVLFESGIKLLVRAPKPQIWP